MSFQSRLMPRQRAVPDTHSVTVAATAGAFQPPSRKISRASFGASIWARVGASVSLAVNHLPIPRLHAGSLPLAPCSLQATRTFYARRIKRLIDITGAAVAIFLSLPVMLMLLAALWLEGGRPIFSQDRLGKGGRRFRMYKLRSMVPDAEAKLAGYLAANPAAAQEWAIKQKLRNDPRVTRLGWFIRKTSLDELPQLFNVLKGDMSLIGPRPMLPDQLPLYLHPSAYLAVRPGLSGLWQVTARNDESFEIRAELDKHYIERLSPGQEARIVLATVRAVVRGTGH